MVATIGMAVGVGMYTVSVIATALILVILVLLEQLEHRIHVGWETRIIRVRISGIVNDIEAYRSVLSDYHVQIVNVFVEYDYEAPTTRLNLVVLAKNTTDIVTVFEAIRNLNPTQAISLANQVSI